MALLEAAAKPPLSAAREMAGRKRSKEAPACPETGFFAIRQTPVFSCRSCWIVEKPSEP